MIERIIEFSIHHRWLVIAAAAVLGVAGLLAAVHTPVDAIPDLSENQVIVFTPWEGHAPEEIEDQITFPLSVSLQGLAQVRVVRGSSDINYSMIHVIFEDEIGIEAARQEVTQQLTHAGQTLPTGVTPYLAPESPATGQIFWYTVEGQNRDLQELREIQDRYLQPQLSSIAGVAEVASVGGFLMEYQVEVDPLRLRLYGISLAKVVDAVAAANSTSTSHVLWKSGAEFITRMEHRHDKSSTGSDAGAGTAATISDLENIVFPIDEHRSVRLGDIATVRIGPQPRRGAFEKDGSEVTGGVISMRYGENPLALTDRIKAKIDELQSSLPEDVRIVTVYDRTPLIRGAIHTVTRTLLEAILAASLCVVVVLLHLRTSLVIAVTLPLAALSAFLAIWLFRVLQIANVETNIMTLAGIVVSIGVLVDAAIVMAENAMFALHKRFGNRTVVGDTRPILIPACKIVGRPIFFSILIMLLSFLPVFALEGTAGKMFRPLAMTKSAALAAAALLAITVVPALCTIVIRGRLRGERESWFVRSVMDVYRPVLDYSLSNPAPLAWVLAVTLVLGFAPLGLPWLFLTALAGGIIALGLLSQTNFGRAAGVVSLILLALIAHQHIQPLQHDPPLPLDEGMVMDMPITVPRTSIGESVDDLKARDMILCRFPEVAMVVGKAGRAETPNDPAPVDMIETMVDFRPEHYWPRRTLTPSDAAQHSLVVLDDLIARKLIAPPADDSTRRAAAKTAAVESIPLFDALMREYAYQRNEEFARELGGQLSRYAVQRCIDMLWLNGHLLRKPSTSDMALITSEIPVAFGRAMQAGPTSYAVDGIMRSVANSLTQQQLIAPNVDLFAEEPSWLGSGQQGINYLLGRPTATFRSRLFADAVGRYQSLSSAFVRTLDAELLSRGALTFTRIVLEELLRRQQVLDERLDKAIRLIDAWREQPPPSPSPLAATGHHHGPAASPPPVHQAQPLLDDLQQELSDVLSRRLVLWKADRHALVGPGGELDRALAMPGWSNVWTMPIQNRVDMLRTGVNTTIGVRVLGRKIEDIVAAAEQVAEIVKRVPGAAGVVVDPIRGKGYLDIRVDRSAAAQKGVSVAELNQTVEAALGGTLATTMVERRARRPVRVQFPRTWREDEDAVRRVPVIARPVVSTGHLSDAAPTYVTLADVADVAINEGPATIKSENGFLRCYVRCNVVGRGSLEFVDEARQLVDNAKLPEGVHVEWTGQFEGETRQRARLALMMPIVVVLIALVLVITYRDVADALLVLLAIPGAIAGGVFFQWLCGFNFSITIWVGYVACFGMAAATGIIMLVYLREAVANAGGLEALSLPQLRTAILDGAVHRLRPKLLTEGTTIIGLAPMLWATGPGADVIRPMAAPVLGGLLVADEVIDLLLPVMFYWVRRRRWNRLHSRDYQSSTAEGIENVDHENTPTTAA